MQRSRVMITIALAAILVLGAVAPAGAVEPAFDTVFQDALYGGLTGALVGGALMVFQDEPLDHLNYIAYGAAGGVLVGAFFGLVGSSGALAQVEGDRVRIGLPALVPVVEPGRQNTVALGLRAELLRVRF